MSKVAEQIAHHLTFPTGVTRLIMILRGLKFEIETGMRLTNKTPKCSTILRKEFGLTGKPEKLYWAFFGELCNAKIISLKDETKTEDKAE